MKLVKKARACALMIGRSAIFWTYYGLTAVCREHWGYATEMGIRTYAHTQSATRQTKKTAMAFKSDLKPIRKRFALFMLIYPRKRKRGLETPFIRFVWLFAILWGVRTRLALSSSPPPWLCPLRPRG